VKEESGEKKRVNYSIRAGILIKAHGMLGNVE
jgi:hypothetical protein